MTVMDAWPQVHLDEAAGVVLAFLTGQDEIEAAAASLAAAAAAHPHPTGLTLHVVPLYAALSPAEQAAAFAPAPPGSRKVVLATNVAETSVTIPGVRYVVDCGFVKARRYSARRGVEALQVRGAH
jgi:HrpA-like RNA helicase